jgi:O-Antigen ligase
MSISLFQLDQKKSRTQAFLDQYQAVLSTAATFLFFSDIPDYLFAASIIPVLPLAWIWLFIFLALPFIKKIKTMPKPLVISLGVYGLISILSLATTSGDERSFQELRLRILSILFVCLMYVLYEQKSLKHIKYAIIAVVALSILNNFYELISPRFFSELNSGRPAGFYINPNKSGCALILGLIFTIDIIKKPYRWLYMFIILSGILATFSRGSILGWIICALFLSIARVLSEKRRTIIAGVFALVILLALTNPLKAIADFAGESGGTYDVLDRLEQFQNPSLNDDSAQERKAVVGYAWIMFGNHPFWGNGLGSTYKWTVSEVSTHNMYLSHMADHGIIGFLFLPGAILAVAWGNRGQSGVQILCFAVFMSLWGIFSHNVLEERYILTTFALLAAMNTNEKWYLKYSTGNFQMAHAPANAPLILPPARDINAIGGAPDRRLLGASRDTFPPQGNPPEIKPSDAQRLLPPSRK